MGPEALAHVLRPLAAMFNPADYPDLLVGLDGADDAAVYRRSEDEAIVVTTDFFTPVVDDPYAYGAIAAANAMSDVFAMGASVLLALNLVAFPEDLDPEIAAEIIRGGAEKVREAGGVVAGGHSVYDREPKFGLAVVGRVDPRRILRKAGARVGDLLVLTKPLGTGLLTTALKRGAIDEASIDAAAHSMARLNATAGSAAGAAGASAATDITGFGLAGHGLEMAERSGVRLAFDLSALPLLDGARALAGDGFAPGGSARNMAAFESSVAGMTSIQDAETWSDLIYDPQTSGGLLIAVDPGDLPALQGAMGDQASDAVVVGVVESGAGIRVFGA